MKTKKSFARRLKTTKKGKILSRQPGFNHFNAKQSRVSQLGGKKMQNFKISAKSKSFLMPNS